MPGKKEWCIDSISCQDILELALARNNKRRKLDCDDNFSGGRALQNDRF